MLFNSLTGTSPMLVHWPGQRRRHLCHEKWVDLVEKCEYVGNIPDLSIYVWNSKSKSLHYDKNTKTLGICEKSLVKRGIQFETIGSEFDVNWYNICKLKCGQDAILKTKTKYVMTLDSSDIVVIGDILSRFDDFKNDKHNVILNADVAHWPFGFDSSFEREVGKGIQRFLNSGAIIAETEFLIDIYRRLNEVNLDHFLGIDSQIDTCIKTDDQIRWKYIYKEYYPNMIVDYDCRYFQTINDISTWMIQWVGNQ